MSNIAKGRIAVYSKEDKLLDHYNYYTGKGMSKKMDEWVKEYSGQEGTYITAQPYIKDAPLVKNKSTFHIPYIRPVVKLENGQEFMRPPSTYNNLPIYNYDE